MPGYFTTQDTGYYMGDSRWVFDVRIETWHEIINIIVNPIPVN